MPIKQNVRFQGTMQPEKNRLDQIQNCHYLLSYEKIKPDQIQNGRLSANIDTNMHNTGQSW